MYRDHQSLGPILGLALLLVLAVAVSPATARLDYEVNGKNYSSPTVQLWYEGHWKQVRSVGSVKHDAKI